MKATVEIPVGSHILVGLSGVSDPGDWRHATVLWTDGNEMLVRQADFGGRSFVNLLPVTSLRGLGDRAFLESFRVGAAREIAGMRAAIIDAERALGQARSAMWERLDEIGATQPGIETAAARASRRRKAARKRIGLDDDAERGAR